MNIFRVQTVKSQTMKQIALLVFLVFLLQACNSNQQAEDVGNSAPTTNQPATKPTKPIKGDFPKKINKPKLSQEEMGKMVKFKDKESGLFGYKNQNGEIITPATYDQVMSYRESDLARVFKDNKFGFVNSAGKEAIKVQYDDAGIFSDGLAAVKVDGKWGYINTSNEFIVKPKYEFTLKFTNKLSSVRNNNKWGYINTKGEEVIPLEYDATGFFSSGLANVKKGSKWGYVDASNKTIIPFKYERTDPFSESSLQAGRVQLNKRFFYIDKTGKCVKDCPK